MKEVELNFAIGRVAEIFLQEAREENFEIISHFDTDGITSAVIMMNALKRLDKKFSLRIVKNLTKEMVSHLDRNKTIVFLDLASGSLEEIGKAGLKRVFVLDHHELDVETIPSNVEILNPHLFVGESLSSSALTYLFCKKLDKKNSEFVKLAVLGMVGDMLAGEMDFLNRDIGNSPEVQRKRGLLIYPSTRPLNRVLEFSSDPFISGVTGNSEGVLDILREAGIFPENRCYKTLLELHEEETENLVTSIVLRNPEKTHRDLVGDLFLVKFFGKLEDAREISARINACSREGRSDVAICFCNENFDYKKKAESIHARYRQQLISGINYAQETKVLGKNYVLLNARDKIKDTMIGTVSSILANSPSYEDGTVVVGMSYNGEGKIKVSGRNVGRTGRNLRNFFLEVMKPFEGEVGGHHAAAGCLVNVEDEESFVERIKECLELEVVRI